MPDVVLPDDLARAEFGAAVGGRGPLIGPNIIAGSADTSLAHIDKEEGMPQHEPDEIASVTLFFGSPGAAFVTGRTVLIDGDQTLRGLFSVEEQRVADASSQAVSGQAPVNAVHRVVVVGGGVSGLDLAAHLAGRHTPVGALEVTLVDNETAHVWKPMLHTLAAGTRDAYQQQVSYLSQARLHGFVFHPGEMTGLDRAAKTMSLAGWLDPEGQTLFPERTLPYDTLILALGSRANDFGTPGVGQYCQTIDSRGQALAFNDRIRTGLMRAFVQDKPLTVAIVGGGATGVELASEIVQLAEASESYGASGLKKKIKVVLLEASDRLLAAFPERVAHDGRQRLEALGVEVTTGASVTAAEPNGFRLRDETLVEADLKVWAAGVKAPDALSEASGLELNRSHQVVVGPHLQSTRDASIYAVGDCASLTLPGQPHALAPTAQVAHQQAAYLSAHLPKLLAGDRVPDFAYQDFGSLLSLGGYGAYGSLGKFGFFKGGFISGRVAQLGHAMLYRSHQTRLLGFWRGGLSWLIDMLNTQLKPSIRLD